MDHLPLHGGSLEPVARFKGQVNVLLGEALLQGGAPKPQVALQHFLAAAGVDRLEQVGDLGLRVACCQCYALMGEAKLAQARATREARQRLGDAVAGVEARLGEAERKGSGVDRTALAQRLGDLRAEEAEEGAFETQLAGEAEAALSRAMDCLYEAVTEEQDRLEKGMSREEARQHPLVSTLWRWVWCAAAAWCLVSGPAAPATQSHTMLVTSRWCSF